MSNNSNKNSSAFSSQPASSITDNSSQSQPNIANSSTPSNLPDQPNIDNSNNPSKNRSSSVPTHISKSVSYYCHSTYSLSITENNTYNDDSADSSDSSKSIISVHNIFSKMKARHTSKQSPNERDRSELPQYDHYKSRGRSREKRSSNQNPSCNQNERSYKIRRGDIEQIYTQNQYLYHLIKEINENVKEMKAEVKRQRKEKESDLSSQVLDISGCVYKCGKAALPATCILLPKYLQGNLEELPGRSIS
ncbi:hypothetical protein C2G38_2229845 [Gigaspora rosea]|uniref:Uncharacterized protein n=1 Tax=Gigaspora rosea TaxID=44941 RepID=A0A397TXW9_9GLOM|nr:hypothetical protein C2G38_2229845 [Gigaspora rosea]